MFDRGEIKARGKAAFKANYWACVIAAIILAFAVGGSSGSSAAGDREEQHESRPSAAVTVAVGGLGLVGLAVQILVLNPLEVGCYRFFLENSREDGEKPAVSEVTFFFRDGRWGNAVKVMFVYKLKILLWSLLFIVPGIVKAYSYRLVPYLLCENPDIGVDEAFDFSVQRMHGQRSAAFVYDLSWIGWYIVGALTLGILLVFHVSPWVCSSNAFLLRALAGEEY